MDEMKEPLTDNTEKLRRFSKTAYYGLKDVILAGDREKNIYFATSIMPFRNWTTPQSFLYFCLISKTCKECTRIFFTEKSKSEILKDKKERISASQIVLAHEIFNYKNNVLTFSDVNKILNNQISLKYLSKEEIDFFLKNTNNLDFAFATLIVNKTPETVTLESKNIRGNVVIKPIGHYEKNIVDIEVIAENKPFEKALVEQRDYYAPLAKDLKIVTEEATCRKYISFFKLLNDYIRDNNLKGFWSNDFLDF